MVYMQANMPFLPWMQPPNSKFQSLSDATQSLGDLFCLESVEKTLQIQKAFIPNGPVGQNWSLVVSILINIDVYRYDINVDL